MRPTVLKTGWTAILALSLATAAMAQPAGESREIVPDGVGETQSQTDATPAATRSDHWGRSIDDIRTDIAQPEDEILPMDHSTQLFSRGMVDSTTEARHEPTAFFMWAPTELYYWPLYFEDVQLERYGQTYSPCFQPVFSGVRFAADFTFVPLKMVFDHPLSCMCTLGYYRPGSRVPCCQRRVLPLKPSDANGPSCRSAREPVTELARLPATQAL